MKKNSDNIEILILGSSHSLMGINPYFFELNTYNLASVSQTLEYDALLFNRYEKDLTKLKYLIIPISYFTLFQRLQTTLDEWQNRNNNIINHYQVYHFNKGFQFISHSQAYGNFKKLFNSFLGKNNKSNYTNLGFEKHSGSRFRNIEEIIESGQQTAKSHSSYNNLDLYKHSIEILETMIEYSINKDVKVILVEIPTHKEYFKHLDDKYNIKTKECIKYLTSKYFNSVIHLPYESSIDFLIDDFYDSDHLNEKGAKKLSKKINGYLMN